ncbi:DNA ligase I, ATP-dependent protein (macronuclear) [Tetrahymena thermophila SB210]|uniref:DNA ligase n=1 Tax=Tetrahymena thermophila (strain SB210) TaxID=312017 RepID=Q24FD9_TETTS|nr:DNA ligase I, ATP-dependent protein [Tetrahymena thermophila SB210]EAS06519.2 DNA ligase I, ATP-dependent protein [Tetrahymena thermophila SB210]|eukprot:XP_001026764.2 DNA ligase I, ATP-dependent protein [Tetrahymena thermophila SB210]
MIKKLLYLPKQSLLSSLIFSKFCTQFNSKSIQSFYFLAKQFDDISKISSRNSGIEAIETLMNDYIQGGDNELFIQMVRLLTCKVDSEEIQIANSSLVEILKVVYPQEDITKFLFEKGDIGLYAKEMLEKKLEKEGNNRTEKNHLSILEVTSFFEKLKNLQGDRSRLEKQELIIDFLKKIQDPLEIQYFIRILSKSLRIGVSEKSIIKALTNINKKKKNSLDSLLKNVQDKIFGYNTALHTDIQIGTPVPPMLAKPVSDFDELLKFLKKYESKKVSLELKYDGERCQVHYGKKKGIKLFSRNLEIQNEKYPQLVQQLEKYFQKNNSVEDCILDGEIVVTDSKGNIKSFQEQQQNRKRKQDSNKVVAFDEDNIEKIYLFDILFLNACEQNTKEQLYRKSLIKENFPIEGPVNHAESKIFDLSIQKDFDELKKLVKQYIDQKEEGAMVKSLDSNTFYDNNGRTQWAKLKKQVLSGGLADTFDVIPIAAYYGKGKRSGVYGSYLLACYDDKKKEYVALCKIGTGFSDQFLQDSTDRLKQKVCSQKPKEYSVHRTFKPDVWFQKDAEVWEVESDSLSSSPIYTIGKMNYSDNGISLRFPRFLRVRDDKTTEQSTKTYQIIEFYNKQQAKPNNNSKDQKGDHGDKGEEEEEGDK